MKNHPEIVGLSFRDRLLEKIKINRDLLYHIGIGILSFLLSNAVLFLKITPFGIALTASCLGDVSIAAGLGAVLGTLAAPQIEHKMKYIAAILIIGAVKWAFSFLKKWRYHPVFSPLLAFFTLLSAGMTIVLVNQTTTYDYILLFSEATIAAAATFFFSRTLTILEQKDRTILTKSDMSCLIITFGLMIVALCSFTIGSLSLGRIAAVLVILVGSFKGGEAGGAIGGTTAGIAICLCDTSCAFLMGAYSFGGLMAGVFSGFGRFGCAAAMIIINGIATALASILQPIGLAPVYEVFIASILFVLIPPSVIGRISLVPTDSPSISTDSVKQIILHRLFSTQRALSELAAITEKVSDKLQKLYSPSFDLNTAISDQVCRECPKNYICWQDGFSGTSDALNEMASLLRHGKTLTLQNIPEHFRTACLNVPELMTSVAENYARQRRLESKHARSLQFRAVVIDQWSGMAQLIHDISAEIVRISVQDELIGKRVREYLLRRRISAHSLSCYTGENGRTTIELSVNPGIFRALDRTELSFDLSELCEREFSLPSITQLEKNILLIFHERPVYRIIHGTAQFCSTGKHLCGDSFKLIEDSDGRSIFILSDGMGNGSLAAVDSSMATTLISRLISAGIGMEAALKLVNSAMLIKSSDESLATIDICCADLYSGKITLYKAGAAPSYIRKNGKVGFVESESLPTGILHSVEFQQTSLQLGSGDIVVMISDGVTQIGEDWVLDELNRFEGTDMQWLCERLSSLARLRRSELHDDDITVFALMIQGGE